MPFSCRCLFAFCKIEEVSETVESLAFKILHGFEKLDQRRLFFSKDVEKPECMIRLGHQVIEREISGGAKKPREIPLPEIGIAVLKCLVESPSLSDEKKEGMEIRSLTG